MMTSPWRRLCVLGVVAVAGAPGALARQEAGGGPVGGAGGDDKKDPAGAPGSADMPAPPSTPREPVSGARTVPEGQRLTFTLIGAGDVMFRTDLDDSPGDVSIVRAGGGLEVGVPIGDRARLSGLFFGEQSWYDFKNATGLVPGTDDPLDEAYRLVLRPLLSWQIDERWGVFGAASLNWGAENGGDLSDAFTVAGFGGVRYSFSDKLSLSLGGGAATQLEDSTEFIPVIGIDWQIDEATRLSTTGVEGIGARLTHGFADAWAVTLQAGYESREFRLADDNALSEGVLRDRRVPIGVGVAWTPSHAVSVEVMGGVVGWQELRFDDRDGNEVSEVNGDPAGFLRVMVRVAF
jgi:hypothetical protein